MQTDADAVAVVGAEDGVDWVAVRADYEGNPGTSLSVIAERHGTTRGILQWRAHHERWMRRNRGRAVGRPQIIARMLRVLERQLMDLENGMTELHRASVRSGEKEVALLGKLAGNLEKLMALEKLATGGKSDKRQTKDMAALRNKLAKRIEQLRLE